MSSIHTSWLYDSKAWWVDAIHSAVCSTLPQVLVSEHCSGGPAVLSDPQLLSEQYGRMLRVIAESKDFEPESARSLLFWAKALKKWKLSDPSTARERRSKALAGFVERNARAANQEMPSSDVLYVMRLILEKWLPPVAPEECLVGPDPEDRRSFCGTTGMWYRQEGSYRPFTGRFGPGACAERWNHVIRLCRLDTWCSDKHWPEVPLSCDDGKHVIARLCAVPKEECKDRLITVEPAYSTFAEQYVRSILLEAVHRGPLRGTAMDQAYVDGALRQQGLALRASKDKTLATLDLKDASDNITWDLVRAVFPSWVVGYLEITRCSAFRDDQTGCVHPMHIYAGMGNATTFMVETLFFSAYAAAVGITQGANPWVSTYGDDIIVTNQLASALLARHDECFVINHLKSFLGDDSLRESCGSFAYEGREIRVPKVDGYLPSWEGRCGVCQLHRTMYLDASPLMQRLSFDIASTGLLDNWPFLVEGYPSISDCRLAYSALPRTRWNVCSHTREAKVRCREQVSRRFSTDWKVAAAHNDPPPQVWYNGVLCGMLGSSSDPHPHAPSFDSDDEEWRFPEMTCDGTVSFPVKGCYKYRQRWRAVRAL